MKTLNNIGLLILSLVIIAMCSLVAHLIIGINFYIIAGIMSLVFIGINKL